MSNGFRVIKINDTRIKILNSNKVWIPGLDNPVYRFIELLSKYNLKDKVILDVGSGSGLIGIYCLLKGARFVTFTDKNEYAGDLTRQNLSLNRVDNRSDTFEIITDNLLDGVNDKKFDFVISNPPVQPETKNIHTDNIAAKSNENGYDGRYVLDFLIQNSQRYLNTGGKLLTSSSSRHGHEKTKQHLDKSFSRGNYKVVLESEHKIIPEYHGLYADYWIRRQEEDKDLRIYLKNKDGTPYSLHWYDQTLAWYFKYYVIEASV